MLLFSDTKEVKIRTAPKKHFVYRHIARVTLATYTSNDTKYSFFATHAFLPTMTVSSMFLQCLYLIISSHPYNETSSLTIHH
jgi:hypothetical protein